MRVQPLERELDGCRYRKAALRQDRGFRFPIPPEPPGWIPQLDWDSMDGLQRRDVDDIVFVLFAIAMKIRLGILLDAVSPENGLQLWI